MIRMAEPLTWDKISRPSQVMIPTYIGLFAVMGWNYFHTDEGLLIKGPALRYANDLPIHLSAWGLMFWTAAILMMVAILTRRRSLYRYGLWLGMIYLFIWAVIFAAAAWKADASPGGWAPWLALAIACKATEGSLLRGDK